MKPMHPGKVLRLDILIAPSALVGSVVIALVAAAVFAARAGLSAREALFGGILAMLLYWLSDLLHHFGHAIAARRTGYPMTGVLLHTVRSLALDSCQLQSALECAGVICGSDQSVDFHRRGIVAAGIHRWQYAPAVLEQIAGSRRVMARRVFRIEPALSRSIAQAKVLLR
jgi:hypothetical protein